MRKLTDRKLEILQNIADKINTEKYYAFEVVQLKDGIYLVPDESRWIGDTGEYLGDTFENAKYNIGIFVNELR